MCNGVVSILDDDTIEITELPVKTWTQHYKETVLEPLMEESGGGKNKDGEKVEKKPALIA